MTTLRLPCGCNVVVDFDKGERLVRCLGGGLTPPNGHTVAREALHECKGGVPYKVTVERSCAVRYGVTPRRRP